MWKQTGDKNLVDTDVASSLLPAMIRNSMIWDTISSNVKNDNLATFKLIYNMEEQIWEILMGLGGGRLQLCPITWFWWVVGSELSSNSLPVRSLFWNILIAVFVGVAASCRLVGNIINHQSIIFVLEHSHRCVGQVDAWWVIIKQSSLFCHSSLNHHLCSGTFSLLCL